MGKYKDISELTKNGVAQYGEMPTDVEVVNDEIPKFDNYLNIWTVPSMGISYGCITMERLEYPQGSGE